MTNAVPPIRSEEEIRQWIIAKVAGRLRVEPSEIPLDESLAGIGLGSMKFVVIVGEMEEWLGCRFANNPLDHYPTVNALSQYVHSQLQAGKTVIDSTKD